MKLGTRNQPECSARMHTCERMCTYGTSILLKMNIFGFDITCRITHSAKLLLQHRMRQCHGPHRTARYCPGTRILVVETFQQSIRRIPICRKVATTTTTHRGAGKGQSLKRLIEFAVAKTSFATFCFLAALVLTVCQ